MTHPKAMPIDERLAALAAAFVLALAGCGGDDERAEPLIPEPATTAETTTSDEVEVPGWVANRLKEKPGQDVQLTFATSDHAVGANRVGFIVVRESGEIVTSDAATVLVARDGASSGVQVEATVVELGGHTHPPGTETHDDPDATQLFAAQLEFERPGRYWIVAEPAGRKIQGYSLIDVKKEAASPAVGSKAPASDNPTITDAPAAEITTAEPPDTALLRYSIADSLEEKAPFVVVFATPAFCQSRTCGPTVEALEQVRKRYEARGVRFIHVEVYEENNPANGVNKWMKEWNLPTEPWVFVVDRDGVIRDKFEGSASVDELTASVERFLL